MHTYTLQYLFNGEPRTYRFEIEQAALPLREAILHVLQLHFGDGENSLLMPAADATPAQVAEQAERVGVTQVRVVGQDD